MQTRLFIGGEFVDALEGGTIEVRNPHDGSLLAEVAEARAADVDLAVDAARAAFPAWAATPRPSGVGCWPGWPTPSRTMPTSWPGWSRPTPATR